MSNDLSKDTDLVKQYDPGAIQDKWYAFWDQHGLFTADPASDKPPHTIMIPLPNVTGALHMGHALNGTLQDLITRWRRMQGYEALWMPGTDHAGIATQAVVERRMLEEEGLTRHDIGRDALVNRIWKWKDAYEHRILDQLKQMGASCDWSRTRFTLDEVCSRAVRRTFLKLFRDGLIYRGKRLVNWDTFLQTAVADDEVFAVDVQGSFWTFAYPLVDSDQQITFATTRPETMLGDSAICVHPSDERYRDLIGKQVRIPINNRKIPIIGDALLADPELGTGAVKVTPAHDPNDYACGLRNNLEVINILNTDGTLNSAAGEFSGLDRYEARQKIVERMQELGYFLQEEERQIPVKHSDRSKTPIEPYLSDQWFVEMKDLAQSAMDAVEDGRVQFFPARYAKTYLDWLGEKRDWCISRQLWWGHRIPIWYCATCQADDLDAAFSGRDDVFWKRDDENGGWLICAEQDLAEDALGTAHSLVQDADVLDTWFSSALWPHATLHWPDASPALDKFYPGNVLVTSRDIITLWVARMVLTGLYNLDDVPFHHVCIHPKILDGFGQTMSKSKGNGVDPMDLIDKYGTDAVRFTIASFAGETQDVRLPIGYECPHCESVIPQKLEHQKAVPGGGDKPRVTCGQCKKSAQYSSAWFDPDPGEPVARIVSERFEYGRNFCNKLWNASRLVLLNLEGHTAAAIDRQQLHMEDRWIISRLTTAINQVTDLLGEYHFDAATRVIRDFTWNEFCDWYLEMLKPRLRNEQTRPDAQRVVVGVLDNLLRILSPFIPYITAELWQRLNERAPERGLEGPQAGARTVMESEWPQLDAAWIDGGLENRFQQLQSIIVAVRNVRKNYQISPTTTLELHLRCDDDFAEDMRKVGEQFANLARIRLVATGSDVIRIPGSASFALQDAEGFIPLEGIIDLEAEVLRQEKEAGRLRGFIQSHEKKLSNESFVSRAPAEVVDNVRSTLTGLQQQLVSVEETLRQLRDS
ncbi:MAG: valine--tRNA ligase [Planctomycetaceae bacterium]